MRGAGLAASVLVLAIVSQALAGGETANRSPAKGTSAAQPASDVWGSVRYLVGDWVGEGSGKPGEGSGSFTFRFDLGESILVRRSHSEYPASGGKPAIVHDDLMVCYPDPAGGRILAIYFDNEGHVIHYGAETDGGERLVLESDAKPSSPGFRLTYTKLAGDTVGIKFEIAAPGRADFVPYLSGKATRAAKP
jgi:hypothetical protein